MIPIALSPRQTSKPDLRRDAEETAAAFPALMVEAEKLAASMVAGVHGRRQSGTGETFWQHRPYGFGDSVASIDWRQSARNDRLYVRQNEWEAAAAVWFWRDPTASMLYASSVNLCEKRHRANVLAIATSILLAQGGERLGVLNSINDPHRPSASAATRLFHGRGAPTKVLEHLDHQTVDGQDHIPFSEKVRPGHRVILFSDFLIDPMSIGDGIARLSAAGARGVLCQILDPAEKDFPFRGRKEFVDTESSDRLLFGNAGTVQAAYQTEFASHQKALGLVSRKTGWPLITHATNNDARSTMVALFDLLAPRRG